MSDTIVLTREAIDETSLGNNTQHSWPLKVTAVSTVAGLESEIFVFHQGLDGPENAVFEAVASVHQMLDLPTVQAGDVDGEPVPYFRAASIEVWLRNAAQVEELWADIQADVADLKANWKSNETLSESETVTI